MKCPACTAPDTKVIDSRLNQSGDITRRRRECQKCAARFTTYERVEMVMPAVIKKDGRRETFNLDKIMTGVRNACQKRPITVDKLESVVSDVERKIQGSGLREIPTRAIGEMIMNHLYQLDKVAYVRFASVYREFRDVDEFLKEVRASRKDPLAEEPKSMTFPFVNET